MKVLVAVKRVVDHNIKVQVKVDGSSVDIDNVKMSMNPFDEIAMEEAVSLREAGLVSEITAISIGSNKNQEILRGALAFGADKAILVETEETLEPLNVAKILAEIARREFPDLILLGKQSIDGDHNQTGQMLAALLAWPQGTFISKLEKQTDSTIKVVREVDGGLETLQLNLPAVVTTDLRLNKPRYLSLPNIMKAKRKPLSVMPVADLGLSLAPHLTTIRVEAPAKRQPGIKVGSVEILIEKLKERGIIDQH